MRAKPVRAYLVTAWPENKVIFEGSWRLCASYAVNGPECVDADWWDGHSK